MSASYTELFKEYIHRLNDLINSVRNSIVYNIGSRTDSLIDLRKEVSYSRIKTLFDKIMIVDNVKEANRFYGIIGIDGSSRAIDTPYAFIGVSSLSIYSNIEGELLDHPPIYTKYTLPRLTSPFIAISLDVINTATLRILKKVFREKTIFTFQSPAGILYTNDYNKPLILDELRSTVENEGLDKVINYLIENISLKSSIEKHIVFIDGPLYPVPNIFKLHYKILHLTSRGKIDEYIASWRTILNYRIRAINKSIKENIVVYGIVKRLELSRLLLSSPVLDKIQDFLGIKIGNVGNDSVLLDLIVNELFKKGYYKAPYKPIVIGPILVPSSETYLDKYVDEEVPDKIVYYVIVPLNIYGSFIRYSAFRAEIAYKAYNMLIEDLGIEPYYLPLKDSFGTGVSIPLSLLYADKRCKRISRSISRLLATYLESEGIPLTYDTLRLIEAISHG